MKRKNPSKPIIYANDTFINMLIGAVIINDIGVISRAISYLKLGEKYCKDCSIHGNRRNYETCICEICLNEYPDDCQQNYCICDYDIKTEKDYLNTIILLAKKYLDKSQIIEFKNKIEKQINDYNKNEYNGSEYIFKIKNNLKYILNKL